jgi:hypothetical protein
MRLVVNQYFLALSLDLNLKFEFLAGTPLGSSLFPLKQSRLISTEWLQARLVMLVTTIMKLCWWIEVFKAKKTKRIHGLCARFGEWVGGLL